MMQMVQIMGHMYLVMLVAVVLLVPLLLALSISTPLQAWIAWLLEYVVCEFEPACLIQVTSRA